MKPMDINVLRLYLLLVSKSILPNTFGIICRHAETHKVEAPQSSCFYTHPTANLYIYIYTVYYIILCYYLMTHIYICLHTIYPIYPPRISVIGVTDWPTSQHVRVPHFTKLFITHPIQIKTRLSFRGRAENGLYMLRV